MKLTNNDFWYCYDLRVLKWLRHEKKISYLCTGKNLSSDQQFWQFHKTDELIEALKELKTVSL